MLIVLNERELIISSRFYVPWRKHLSATKVIICI